ncbi:o-succinylbenzoate synthase [Pseudoglutamicibacter cumminsii]|uniref:o-succinylbenzoate synthase n=1 Tax=Pseudoglutamicibacter cumminsii TaxID=156979 RepID=A0ABX5L6W0_9MICC|nr:o-succinylbenzoate synthase [Pseudoglutamicibacter cumminsii]PWI28303.1 O-succinylbenzoate synthase [Pseudoglutamicibacter cumminsii]
MIERGASVLWDESVRFPSLAELKEAAVVVRLPMNVRFRGVVEREVLLLEGPAGWGEFSPFLEYGPAEASRWLVAGVEAAWRGWPEPVRDAVPVNGTVPAVAAERVPEVLARYDGVGTVKVKVAERGQSVDEDVARVAAVARELPGVRIRVDANEGWDHKTAVDALSRLAEFDLEYAEQPVAGIEGLARLREALDARGVGVRLAADEAVRKSDDPLKVARMGAAEVIIVKVQPLGGVRAALQIVEQAGLDAVVSSALDSSVGLAGGVALAAALPELKYACGLGTGALFDDDVVVPGLKPQAGVLPVGAVVPERGKLEALAVDAGRRAWWMDRLEACYAELLG